MIKNGKGGGNTKTGLVFEGKTDLATFLNDQNGYRVVGNIVFFIIMKKWLEFLKSMDFIVI